MAEGPKKPMSIFFTVDNVAFGRTFILFTYLQASSQSVKVSKILILKNDFKVRELSGKFGDRYIQRLKSNKPWPGIAMVKVD